MKIPQMFIDVVVKDKNGVVIKRLHRRGHSYVRQMMDVLRQLMAVASTADVKDTSGNMRAVGASPYRVIAAAADANYGVQVGTGTNAVTISNYVIQTLIAHGTGSGQLQYGSTSVGTVAIVSSTAQFTIARTFTNVSGAQITVTEVTLVQLSAYYFLLERSLLTFAIPNGGNATVTYTLKVTV